jgi:hypothetical protein
VNASRTPVSTSPPASAVIRAMPKSMISASSPLPTITFAGFRSRCTTPAECAATRPAHTCRAILSTRGTVSFCSLSRIEARSMPSTNDIVMYLMPEISPRSWMRTTFRCVTRRASSSSRLKRRWISAAAAGSAMISGRISLIATSTLSSVSHAR